MENSKHHIDKFLREKMQKMPVEFNEEHWQDAERRLDEDDKKKRPFVLFFIIGVLLVGLGTSAIKKINNVKKTKQQVAKNDKTVQKNAQEASMFKQANYEELKEQANTTSPNSSNSSSDKITPEQTNKLANPNGTKNKYAQNGTSKYSSKVTNTPQSSATNFKSNTNAVPNDHSDKKMTRQSNVHSNTIQTTDNKKSVKSNAIVQEQSKNTENKANAKTSDADQHAKNTNHVAENQVEPSIIIDNTHAPIGTKMAIDRPKKASVRIYKTPEELQKLNPRYVNGLEDYVFTRRTLSAEKSDSIRNASKEPELIADVAKKVSRPATVFEQAPSSFFLMAGLAGTKGYSGSGDEGTDYGISPSLGIGYQMNFSDRMSLYLTMYMSYISHLNITETGTRVSYSFDKDSTFISVTRKNLLQLQIPLQLAYKIRPRHIVYGGLGINLGLNSVSLYEDSKQSSAQKQFGYMSGIRFMDVNASLGYEFRVSRKLSIGAFYQQGFFDMTKNNYFNNQQNDNNARGGINLRYNFLK